MNLTDLMNHPLPTIYQQRRLQFRPPEYQVHRIYDLLNDSVFKNKLKKPELIIRPRCRKFWGMCHGQSEISRTGSYCRIHLMDKWFSVQWMVTILAHEMVHQYQWDICGPEREQLGKESIMSHGPSFFQFKDSLKEHGIPLKTAHSMRRWYLHQNLFKC